MKTFFTFEKKLKAPILSSELMKGFRFLFTVTLVIFSQFATAQDSKDSAFVMYAQGATIFSSDEFFNAQVITVTQHHGKSDLHIETGNNETGIVKITGTEKAVLKQKIKNKSTKFYADTKNETKKLQKIIKGFHEHRKGFVLDQIDSFPPVDIVFAPSAKVKACISSENNHRKIEINNYYFIFSGNDFGFKIIQISHLCENFLGILASSFVAVRPPPLSCFV